MSTAIILKFLTETVKALFFKIAWQVVIERFFTRLVVHGLRKLAKMSSNDLVDETVDDLLAQLNKKRLPEAK